MLYIPYFFFSAYNILYCEMMNKTATAAEIRSHLDRCLPDKASELGEKLAFNLFDQFDKNANGYASLA